MAAGEFYRYLSNPVEIQRVRAQRRVETINPRAGGTWYTPTRYNTSQMAQQDLALPIFPTHRIGPILNDQVPAIAIGFRRVIPAFGQPGGGVEVLVRGPVWLLGLWDFAARQLDPQGP